MTFNLIRCLILTCLIIHQNYFSNLFNRTFCISKLRSLYCSSVLKKIIYIRVLRCFSSTKDLQGGNTKLRDLILQVFSLTQQMHLVIHDLQLYLERLVKAHSFHVKFHIVFIINYYIAFNYNVFYSIQYEIKRSSFSILNQQRHHP